MVKTYVGNLEVISSGTVHVNSDNKLNLNIDGVLDMAFEFITDDVNKDMAYKSEVEGNTLTWKLRNFSNPLGSGVLTPLHLGSIREKKLFASFFVWTPNEKDSLRIVNYVIYLEKEN